MGRPESSSTLFIAPSAALDKLDYIGAATVADAILDRLLNGAHRLQLIGDSMRRSEEVSKTALRRKLKKLTDRDRLRYVLTSVRQVESVGHVPVEMTVIFAGIRRLPTAYAMSTLVQHNS